MSTARTVVKALGVLAVGVILIGAGGYVWAGHAADAYLARTYDAHRQGFPIPFPLTEEEIAQLRAERAAATVPTLTSMSAGTGPDAAAVAPRRPTRSPGSTSMPSPGSARSSARSTSSTLASPASSATAPISVGARSSTIRPSAWCWGPT